MPGRVEIGVFLEGEQAVAEAAVLDKSLDNIGKAGASGANQAKAGLNNLEKAAVSTKDSIAQYDKVILDSRAHLANLSQQLVDAKQKFGSNSEQANVLKTKMAEVGAATRGLVAEKALLVAESKIEEAAVNASTSAFSKKTTMINTGQGALKGYDAALTGMIRSMGGINLGLAVGISLAASLLPIIISLISAKEEQIKIDKEQIDLDLRRNNAQERNTRIHADLVTAFRLIASEQEKYQRNSRQLTYELGKLAEGQEIVTGVNQKTGQIYLASSRDAGELRKSVAELNKAIGEQEKILQPALEVIFRHKEATGQSTEATLEWANAIGHFAPEQIDFFRQRLNALMPELDEFDKKLKELAAPRFDVSSSLPGIGALRASVQGAFQTARDQGLTDWFDQVRFAAPAIKALDEALKHYAGTQAGYRKELAGLEEGERAAISTMHAQQKAYKGSFEEVKKLKDMYPQLREEILNNALAIAKENHDVTRQRELIAEIFDFKRERMIADRTATEATTVQLVILQKQALDKMEHEMAAYYQQLNAQRNQDLTRSREFREKELLDFKLHLVKQRQFREEEDRKFRDEQAKLDFAARSNRPGRLETELNTVAGEQAKAAALRTVQDAFGGAAQSAALYNLQVKIANGQSVSFGQSFKAIFSEVFGTVQAAIGWFSALGNAFGSLFEGMVTGAKKGKALIFSFIADMLQAVGQMAIAVGTILLFLPPWLGGNPGLGGALIAAGIAAMALAGVFRGLASNAQKAGQSSSAGGGAATSAAGGGGTRRDPVPAAFPFPTSGPNTIVVINRFDKGGMKAAMRGEEFVTVSDLREGGSSAHRAVKKIAA